LFDVESPKVTPLLFTKASRPTVAEVAESDTVHDEPAGAVVRYAGTPNERPLVLKVPTTAVPAVVVLVKPIPAEFPAEIEIVDPFWVTVMPLVPIKLLVCGTENMND
jgi:hypothetical protein